MPPPPPPQQQQQQRHPEETTMPPPFGAPIMAGDFETQLMMLTMIHQQQQQQPSQLDPPLIGQPPLEFQDLRMAHTNAQPTDVRIIEAELKALLFRDESPGSSDESRDDDVFVGIQEPDPDNQQTLLENALFGQHHHHHTDNNNNNNDSNGHILLENLDRVGAEIGSEEETRQQQQPWLPVEQYVTDSGLRLFAKLVPTEAEINRKTSFFDWLGHLIHSEWPEVKLHMFGSTANWLCVTGSSDVDVCLVTPPSFDSHRIMQQLTKMLRQRRMKDVLPVLHARVPIVKFLDPQSKCRCDICVNNVLAVHNTRMLYHYSQIDERFRQMAFIVKHWAKQRKINDPHVGTLSSYAYLLMVIYYLQHTRPPVLPVLQDLKSFGRLANQIVPVFVDHCDCTYMNLIDKWKQEQQPQSARNHSSLGLLLVGFFRYFALDFDFNKMVVSIRTHQHLTKRTKGWTNPNQQRNFICIEDPFETDYNVGRVVSDRCLEIIKFEFQRAHSILEESSDLFAVCELCTRRQRHEQRQRYSRQRRMQRFMPIQRSGEDQSTEQGAEMENEQDQEIDAQQDQIQDQDYDQENDDDENQEDDQS